MGEVWSLGEEACGDVLGLWSVTVWAQMLGLVCLAPRLGPWGKDPSAQQETWSRSCLAARPEWKLHPSIQAAEAAGECDEAAEMGPLAGGMQPRLPRNPALVLPTENS